MPGRATPRVATDDTQTIPDHDLQPTSKTPIGIAAELWQPLQQGREDVLHGIFRIRLLDAQLLDAAAGRTFFRLTQEFKVCGEAV